MDYTNTIDEPLLSKKITVSHIYKVSTEELQ